MHYNLQLNNNVRNISLYYKIIMKFIIFVIIINQIIPLLIL